MDKQIAKDNLFQALDVMESNGIKAFLIFGTLLGAVREGGFIPHDEDMDVGVFERDKEAFLSAQAELEGLGFVLARNREERAYDFERGGVSLDFFMVREIRTAFGKKAWDLDGRTTVAHKHLVNLDRIDFLGKAVLVPLELPALMHRLYGFDWRTPRVDRPAYFDFTVRVQRYLKRASKKFIIKGLKGQRP